MNKESRLFSAIATLSIFLASNPLPAFSDMLARNVVISVASAPAPFKVGASLLPQNANISMLQAAPRVNGPLPSLGATAVPHAPEIPAMAAPTNVNASVSQIATSLSARPAASIAFDGARKRADAVVSAEAFRDRTLPYRGQASVHENRLLPPRKTMSWASKSAIAGILPLVLPAVAAASGTGAAAAMSPLLLMLLVGPMGLGLGVFSAVGLFVLAGSIALTKTETNLDFKKVLMTGGALGYAAAIIGALQGPGALDLVMSVLGAAATIPLMSAVVITLIRDWLERKNTPTNVK